MNPHDHHSQTRPSEPLLLHAILCALPLLVLLIALVTGWSVPWWAPLLLMLGCAAGAMLMGRSAARVAGCCAHGTPTAVSPDAEDAGADREALRQALATPDFTASSVDVRHDGIIVRGQLHGEASDVLAAAERATEALPWRPTILLDRDEAGQGVLLVASSAVSARLEGWRPRVRPLLAFGLLGLTLLTTTTVGAANAGIDVVREPSRLSAGLPYALALLLILVVHELGHLFAARRHGVPTSLPYFIPVPFGLGTFGAFVQMSPLARDRRQVFDIGVAGPLAGLAVAIPALLIGLRWSSVITDAGTAHTGGTDVGSSLVLALAAKATLGGALLDGHLIQLHPIALAGWIGMVVTALNLIPVGQLDGGHVAYGMFGGVRARTAGATALALLVVLGLFVWPGLLSWALIAWLLAGSGRLPPRDAVTPIGWQRRAIGWAIFVLLALILLPVPHRLFSLVGVHCPYT